MRARLPWLLCLLWLACATRAPEVVAGALDARAILAPLALRAAHAGAGELTPLGARFLEDDEQLGAFVMIDDDACLLAIARAAEVEGESAGDVDLFAFTDAGERIGADEAPDPRAAVLVCPPHPRRVYVMARAASGGAVVALGAMRVAPAHADAVARAAGVRGRAGQDTGALDEWPGLERLVREHRARLGSRWEDVRRVVLPLSASAYSSLPLPLEADRCLDVLVTPGEEVQGFDAVVLDGRGRVVARGESPGRDRSFVLCGELAEILTLMVRPRVTSGVAAVVIGRSKKGAVTELDARVVVAPSAIAELDAALALHGERTRALELGAAADLGTVEVGLDGNATAGVALAAGCSRIDLVAGKPLGPFAAALWSADGRELGRTHGGESAALFWCGELQGARLEITALARAGPLAVRARLERAPAPALSAHPLGAARLLAQLDEAAGPTDIERAAAVEAAPLGARERVTRELAVAPGRCRLVVAALEGASGLTLSLRAAGAPSRRSTATVAASERICAGGSPLAATVEMGAERGAGSVLWLALDTP